MKKLPIFLMLLVAVVIIPACKLDPEKNTWEYYEDWRNANNEWLNEQTYKLDANGKSYYQKVIAGFDPNAYVLVHYFNDRSKTADNLSPLLTSTVDVKYRGRTYDNVAFDSSYLQTDSVYRTKLTSVVTGWTIALMDMHVGDSCEVIIPYQQGYGNVAKDAIKPYSHLVFNMKLVDIPVYEQ